MYGSSLIIVTRRPRHLSSRPSEDAVSPLPREEETPPVTKTYLLTLSTSWRTTLTLVHLRGAPRGPWRRLRAIPRHGAWPMPMLAVPTASSPAPSPARCGSRCRTVATGATAVDLLLHHELVLGECRDLGRWVTTSTWCCARELRRAPFRLRLPRPHRCLRPPRRTRASAARPRRPA